MPSGYSVNIQAAKVLKAHQNPLTKFWGFCNEGDKYYWWKEAHSQGENNEDMNCGYDTEWAISAQYDKVGKDFSESLVGVELHGKVGFIDVRNRFIIAPQFEPVAKLYGFSHGLAAVKKDGKYGFINKKGEFVIPPIYDYAENFGENMLATVKKGKKFGAIDLKGDTVVPCRHVTEETMKLLPIKNKEYRNAVKKVKVLDGQGYYDDVKKRIDGATTVVDELIKDSTFVPPYPTLAIVEANGLYGMKHEKADTAWLVPPACEKIQPASNGLYYVTMKTGTGVGDAYGRMLTPCIYERINYQPQENLFIVSTKSGGNLRVGLVSDTGAMIIPNNLDSISDFKNGLATTVVDGITGTIDHNGQVGDGFINKLLANGGSKGFYRRIVGLRPTCAQAHNAISIADLQMGNYKEGISRLKLAHKLCPADKEIAENLEKAKSDRKERRYNRILNVLDAAGKVLDVAATTYSASTGNTVDASESSSSADVPSAPMSSGSATSGSKRSSSSRTTSDRDVAWMKSNYQSQKNVYSNYESQIMKMSTYPEQYNASRCADMQCKMKQIRETIVSHGGTCTQSRWETWRP